MPVYTGKPCAKDGTPLLYCNHKRHSESELMAWSGLAASGDALDCANPTTRR